MKTLALAFLLFASTPIVIDTSKLPDSGALTRIGGSRIVTVSREGQAVVVTVAEGKRVDTVTLTRDGEGKLTIGRRDNGEPRQLLGLDRRPVIVDGIDLEPYLAGNALGGAQQTVPKDIPAPDSRFRKPGPRFYICPKDETMVRVPAGKAPPELKCPLDGTPMKSGTGPDSQIFLLD